MMVNVKNDSFDGSTSKTISAIDYAKQGVKVHRLWWVNEDGTCACGDPHCGNNNGKHPIASWKAERTNDPEKVAELWEGYPKANIGITGYTIIDADRHDGRTDGVNAWLSLLKKCGPVNTWIAETPGGGLHYYFQPDPDIGNSEGNLPDGINVRGGDTGYVVAPPSNHVGGVYRWKPGFSPGTIEEPAELPSEIKKLIKTKKQMLSSNGQGPAEIMEGHRNQTLTSIAGHLFNIPDMSATTLSISLQAMNSELCKPPLPESEINGIVKSAFDNFKRHDLSNHTAADLSAWDDQLHNPLDVDRSKLMAGTVVKDLLYERGMTVIAGEGGVGKTSILMDMVTRACKGCELWLSKSGRSNEATRHLLPFSTLYIDFDMGLPLVAMSSLLADQYEVTVDAPGKVRVLSDPNPMPDVWDNQQVDQLARFASERGFYLIIFDSMAFMGGNKSMKDDEFGRRLNEIARIFRKYNLMSILVHHTNRQGGYFGSAYIQHSVTNLVLITRDGEDILFKVIKNRYGPVGRTWKLRSVPRITKDGEKYFTFDGVGALDGDRLMHILREALEHSGDKGMNVTGIIRTFKDEGFGEKKARQTIEKAVADDLVVLHPDAHDRNKLYVWNKPPEPLL